MNVSLHLSRLSVALLVTCFAPGLPGARADEVGPLVSKLRSVKPKAEGHREATAAWQQLAKLPADRLPEVLAGMDGATDLSANWIRAVADAIAQRELRQGRKLPVGRLEEFLADTDHSPRGRQAAFELIVLAEPNAPARLVPTFLDDPSMELRRLAVAQALDRAAALLDQDGKQSDAVAAYRRALSSARDVDQIDAATEQLRKLDQQVDLPSHFGFLLQWRLIGPFDNRDKRGFDVAYPPEKEIDVSATYPGLDGDLKWIEHTTTDPYGTVDLNKAIGKHMGAIAYAYTEFNTPAERDVELRLGCINGNKIWLNGELLTANHVYHAGTQIDQYVGKGRLKQGANRILVKVAQNEQTEDWAQRWQFQLRVCDQYGTAILSTDRPATELSSR